MKVAVLLVALMATVAARSGAQQPAGDPSGPTLPGSLSPATREALLRILDSVQKSGLPHEPLIARAAEGVLKGVPEERLLAAVNSLARRLDEARDILNGGSPMNADAQQVATLLAATSAMQAGASHTMIMRLSESARGSHTELAAAYIALADLATNRVPADAATGALERLLVSGAQVGEINSFRAAVARDVQAGRPPASALSERMQGAIRNLDGARAPARPPGVPPPPP